MRCHRLCYSVSYVVPPTVTTNRLQSRFHSKDYIYKKTRNITITGFWRCPQPCSAQKCLIQKNRTNDEVWENYVITFLTFLGPNTHLFDDLQENSFGTGISWSYTRHSQGFWPRINCSQMKLPNFGSIQSQFVKKCQFWTFKVNFLCQKSSESF